MRNPLPLLLPLTLSACPQPGPPAASPNANATSNAIITPPPPSTWPALRAAAAAAFRAKDFPAWRDRIADLYAFSHGGSSHVLVELAAAEARVGHPGLTLAHLRAYVAMGLDANLEASPSMAPLASDPTFKELAALAHKNSAPVGATTLAFALPHEGLVTEGLAWDDATQTYFVSSVRARKILAIDAQGKTRDFVPSAAGGVGAMCGIAAARGRLWVATATMPPMVDFHPADPRPTALLAYDTRTGALVERIDLAAAGPGEHTLTDLAVAPSGDVFVSDASGGMVYVARKDAHELEPLSQHGVFVSPQTPVPTPDGRRLLVPDYVLGLASIDLATHLTTWVPHPPTVALDGIDDLHFDGASLVAIQNGTTPVRIVRFALSPDLSRIEGATVLDQGTPDLGDPTHGVLRDGAFVFLANAGWDRFDDDGALVPDAHPDAPAVLRLPLR